MVGRFLLPHRSVCFFNALVLQCISWMQQQMNFQKWSVSSTYIESLPIWVQAIIVIFISDFIIYWAHRAQHSFNFLWRFHKVHHTAEHLDWLAAHREHPLDSIYTIFLINFPAMIFGFHLQAIAIFIAFRGIWAIYIHSNVRLNIGIIKYIIGSPEMHHLHHELERDRGNYANLSPLLDLMFGTHYNPPNEPEHLGISEKTPKHYIGQMIEPLLPYKVYWTIENTAKRFLHNKKL
jgi:sterol desaturase/sphingolipid hydroxylase (fatty acid hydroxylase superfamily)